MADPVSMFAVGSSVAGTAIKAYGDWFAGDAQAKQAQYQAELARVNARLAKQDAIYETQRGEVQAQQVGLKERARVGATKVAFGAGNIDVATGSPAKVVSSEIAIGQANEATVRANAAKRAYGFNVAAAQDITQAGIFDTAASTAKTASYINMASTIVGGAGNVADKWLQGSQYFPQGSSPGVNPDSAAGRQTYSSSIYS